MGPGNLVDQMGRLNVSRSMNFPDNNQRTRDITPDAYKHTGVCYLGYTFFKAQPNPGHKATWAKAEKTRMNLSQSDLINLVQRKAKRISVAGQYQDLTISKQSHVDRLIEDLRRNKPEFQWMCVYVKEVTRDVKGKKFRRGGYETTSMDIILMGKPLAPSYPERGLADADASFQVKDRIPPVGPEHPISEQEPRMVAGGIQPDEQCNGQNFHPQQMPPHIHPSQQPASQFHQQGPPLPPPRQHPVGGPPCLNQGPWTQGTPAGAHVPQHTPVVHGQMGPRPHNDNIKHATPQPGSYHVQPGGAGHRRGKSPMQAFVSEPEPVGGSTSSGEDYIFSLDPECGNSEVDLSGEDVEASEKQAPFRGSLFRGHSAEKSKRSRDVYRTHSRKHALRSSSRKLNRYREEGSIELIPSEDRHAVQHCRRAHGGGSRELGRQPPPPPPPQPPISLDDLDLVYVNHLHGGRAKNDIRDRYLKNWEANLTERERLVEINTRMLNDRIHDVGILGRYRSLWEPGTMYPSRYLADGLH
ncbi:hypothetical protein AOCH_000216 [Aspergillus ochraceoroseus]|nr:hypothetical protein AOCH_000216 [Aspergillus ochraceoroseus]